jgi:hypothetical protein
MQRRIIILALAIGTALTTASPARDEPGIIHDNQGISRTGSR